MTATVCMLFRPRDGAIEAALTMEVDATSDGDAMATVEVAVAMKVAVAMEVASAMEVVLRRWIFSTRGNNPSMSRVCSGTLGEYIPPVEWGRLPLLLTALSAGGGTMMEEVRTVSSVGKKSKMINWFE